MRGDLGDFGKENGGLYFGNGNFTFLGGSILGKNVFWAQKSKIIKFGGFWVVNPRIIFGTRVFGSLTLLGNKGFGRKP